ncbi:hypothetical protein [Mycobacterium sp.]|uniref:hypothetical protein n=1 Tax=Mycobacterium sp. TaxID=1785 RepID=UPI003A8C1D3A
MAIGIRGVSVAIPGRRAIAFIAEDSQLLSPWWSPASRTALTLVLIVSVWLPL